VKAGAAATGVVVGATADVAGATTTFFEVEEHPLNATAPTRRADIPTERAGRDEGSEK